MSPLGNESLLSFYQLVKQLEPVADIMILPLNGVEGKKSTGRHQFSPNICLARILKGKAWCGI